eukprot:SAG11_NODE_133_length_15400_cov_10.132344_11_plen_78_part_00
MGFCSTAWVGSVVPVSLFVLGAPSPQPPARDQRPAWRVRKSAVRFGAALPGVVMIMVVPYVRPVPGEALPVAENSRG